MQTIVDQFNLSKWFGQEEARIKLVQAGYRGQAPYVTFLFFRMISPVVVFLVARPFYLFVVLNLDQPTIGQARHLHRRRLCRHAPAADVPEEQDPSAGNCRSSAPFPTRSTCC